MESKAYFGSYFLALKGTQQELQKNFHQSGISSSIEKLDHTAEVRVPTDTDEWLGMNASCTEERPERTVVIKTESPEASPEEIALYDSYLFQTIQNNQKEVLPNYQWRFQF